MMRAIINVYKSKTVEGCRDHSGKNAYEDNDNNMHNPNIGKGDTPSANEKSCEKA